MIQDRLIVAAARHRAVYWLALVLSAPIGLLSLAFTFFNDEAWYWISARAISALIFIGLATQCLVRIFWPMFATRWTPGPHGRIRVTLRIVCILSLLGICYLIAAMVITTYLNLGKYDLTSDAVWFICQLFALAILLSDICGVKVIDWLRPGTR